MKKVNLKINENKNENLSLNTKVSGVKVGSFNISDGKKISKLKVVPNSESEISEEINSKESEEKKEEEKENTKNEKSQKEEEANESNSKDPEEEKINEEIKKEENKKKRMKLYKKRDERRQKLKEEASEKVKNFEKKIKDFKKITDDPVVFKESEDEEKKEDVNDKENEDIRKKEKKLGIKKDKHVKINEEIVSSIITKDNIDYSKSFPVKKVEVYKDIRVNNIDTNPKGEEKEEEEQITSEIEASYNSEIEGQELEEVFEKGRDLRKRVLVKNISSIIPRKKIELKELWENPQYNSKFKKLDTDLLSVNLENIFLPPSLTNIDGEQYEFLGAFLDEISDDTFEVLSFIQGMNEAGFTVPDPLFDVSQGQKVLSWNTMILKWPELFAYYGPINGLNQVFSKPSSFKKLHAIAPKKVNYQEISKLLGNVPRELKKDQYVSELLSLFYLDIPFSKDVQVTVNSTLVIDTLEKSLIKCREYNRKNDEELEELFKDPGNKIRSVVASATYYPPEETINLIREDQSVGPVLSSELSTTIKTSLKMFPPDSVTCTILAYLVNKPVSQDVLNIMIDNYVGTGVFSDIGKRYNKSLEIYMLSNSKENKKFHKKYYKENFSAAMEYLGYSNCPDLVKVPSDTNDFLSFQDLYGSNLIKVNNRAKGTFTSKKKRDQTAFIEIKTGLYHFHHLEESVENESYIYFYYGFKKIGAKLKDEIHSYAKPPRFYNPTFIGALIPFQFLFNYCFQKFLPNTKECPFSLLGIKDVGTNFYDVMMSFLKSENKRMHYSDNFWIKEGDLYVSVDVKRCDSNLSPQALTYPIEFFASKVLKGKDLERMKILAKMFKKTIPREAFFGLKRGKKSFLCSLPFYWLPSGVVGTAYINHLFTGLFLYYTKDVKWLERENNLIKLTPKLLECAKTFGIQLEVAATFDFGKLKDGDIIPFDLLARSGIYYQGEIVPLLEETRVWKALLFMKKQKYDKNSQISNFIRLCKTDSLVRLGAMLYPVVGDFIYSLLVYLLSNLRDSQIKLSRPQADALVKELEELKIDPISYEVNIYNTYIPSAMDYIKEKTGKEIKIPQALEYDKMVMIKMDEYPAVWASLIEVIDGSSSSQQIPDHPQNSTHPYFVAPYYIEGLKKIKKKDKVNFNMLASDLVEILGENRGVSIAKDLLRYIIKNFDSVEIKEFRHAFKKEFKELKERLLEKGFKEEKVLKYLLNMINIIKVDPELENFKIEVDSSKQRPRVNFVSRKRDVKPFMYLVNKIDLQEVLNNSKLFWLATLFERFTQTFNAIASKLMFEGFAFNDLRGKARIGELRPINQYRKLPFRIYDFGWLDPYVLKLKHSEKFSGNKDSLLELGGLLEGYLIDLKERYPTGKSKFTGEVIFSPLEGKKYF